MITYDTWKTTDKAMERAGRLDEALDKYEAEVWHEVLRLSERRYEAYRDQLHDQMVDGVGAENAAQNFLESCQEGEMDVTVGRRPDRCRSA